MAVIHSVWAIIIFVNSCSGDSVVRFYDDNNIKYSEYKLKKFEGEKSIEKVATTLAHLPFAIEHYLTTGQNMVIYDIDRAAKSDDVRKLEYLVFIAAREAINENKPLGRGIKVK